METIEPTTVVSEIMKNYPRLTDYLLDLGLCGCGHDSTLNWTVSRVSRENGIDLTPLLEELNKRK
jgi:hypothetical protein